MSVCDELADCDGVLFQELDSDSSYLPFFLQTAAAPNFNALTNKQKPHYLDSLELMLFEIIFFINILVY
jgi:hypothetical protein